MMTKIGPHALLSFSTPITQFELGSSRTFTSPHHLIVSNTSDLLCHSVIGLR